MSTNIASLIDKATRTQSLPWRGNAPPATGSVVRDFVLAAASNSRTTTAEREAYDRGFSDGHRRATESSSAAVQAQLARLGTGIEDISALRSQMLRRSEQDIVRLALAMAHRILGREITANRDHLLFMARAAAAKLGGAGVVTIQVNPADFSAIENAERFADGPVRLVANAHLDSGACRVESAIGMVDASLRAQIEELFDALITDDTAF